jgi:hypothetical protein
MLSFAFEGRGSGFAINIELFQNIYDPHACVPSMPIGHGRHLESIVDACVEGHEACTLSVLHQLKVVLQSVAACVDGGLFSAHQWCIVHGFARYNQANVDRGIT